MSIGAPTCSQILADGERCLSRVMRPSTFSTPGCCVRRIAVTRVPIISGCPDAAELPERDLHRLIGSDGKIAP